MLNYKNGDYDRAARFFESYYNEHPQSETTLYYLYDCYLKLNRPEACLAVLKQFVAIGTNDENVYLNLLNYYRKDHRYSALFELLSTLKSPVKEIIDKKYHLTRLVYAELICGVVMADGEIDPLVFATTHDLLPRLPDGHLYGQDPITWDNLIILLDRFIKPFYPKQFYPMTRMSNHSFSYLPYMRLVELGLLEFDPELEPTEDVILSNAVEAIGRMKNNGLVKVKPLNP